MKTKLRHVVNWRLSSMFSFSIEPTNSNLYLRSWWRGTGICDCNFQFNVLHIDRYHLIFALSSIEFRIYLHQQQYKVRLVWMHKKGRVCALFIAKQIFFEKSYEVLLAWELDPFLQQRAWFFLKSAINKVSVSIPKA